MTTSLNKDRAAKHQDMLHDHFHNETLATSDTPFVSKCDDGMGLLETRQISSSRKNQEWTAWKLIQPVVVNKAKTCPSPSPICKAH